MSRTRPRSELIEEAREAAKGDIDPWETGLLARLADALEEEEDSGYDTAAILRRVRTRRDAILAEVERAYGWLIQPIPGFTVENQMAEASDAVHGILQRYAPSGRVPLRNEDGVFRTVEEMRVEAAQVLAEDR